MEPIENGTAVENGISAAGNGDDEKRIADARAIVAGLAGKRGKRSGDERAAIELVRSVDGDVARNPAAEFAPSDSGSDNASTGKPRNRGTARKGESAPLSSAVSLLARKIYGVHMMAALALKLPELAIEETEARDLADAVLTVGQQYDVKITGKAAAGINLLVTACIIYGPKLAMIYMRKGGAAPVSSAMPSATAAAAKKAQQPKAPEKSPSIIDAISSGQVGKPEWLQ